mmetsp:Transcript_40359/g.94833  ORF Transcript_40359/g.94833 Transcript_40359/m.94833 type:complete len:89 (-) Transcript_40359:856-1122(-)
MACEGLILRRPYCLLPGLSTGKNGEGKEFVEWEEGGEEGRGHLNIRNGSDAKGSSAMVLSCTAWHSTEQDIVASTLRCRRCRHGSPAA